MSDDEKIIVGKIVAAQGLRGEFRVRTFTERPDDLAGLPAGVKFVRAAGPNVAICKMDGVDDRTAAEKLCGTELFINHNTLPKLKKGEHYIHDLIGMKVITNPESRIPNSVVYVHNFGAGDILELDNGDMISFNGATVNYDKKEIEYEK